MNLFRQKRILILIIIISLVVSPVTLFLSPKKANAVVPVLDSENLVQNSLTADLLRQLVDKEVGQTSVTTGGGGGVGSAVGSVVSALTGGGTGANAVTNAVSALTGGNSKDALAWTAINITIELFTQSVLNWINSGFNGGPGFVTDLRGFLLDIADAETALFIEGTALEALCSPWKLDIKIALSLPPTGQFEREVACTLSDIVANMDDFINGDFSQGGWAGWFELTTKPQNNPYGLYLMTSSELDQRIAGKQQEETQLLDWGDGFFSKTECEELPPGFVGPPRCEVVTPGSLVEEKLNNAYFAGQRRLEVADEMNEIISALMRQLFNKFFSSDGLRGLGEGSSNNISSFTSNLSNTDEAEVLGGLKIRFNNEINSTVQSETEYRDIKQGTLNAVDTSKNLLVNLRTCYEGKLAGSLSSGNRAIAQQRINNANAAIADNITVTEGILENNIASTDQNLAEIAVIQSQIPSTTSLEQIRELDESFSLLLRSSEMNGSSLSLQRAQKEQEIITEQMSSLNTTTNAQIAECQTFPLKQNP